MPGADLRRASPGVASARSRSTLRHSDRTASASRIGIATASLGFERKGTPASQPNGTATPSFPCSEDGLGARHSPGDAGRASSPFLGTRQTVAWLLVERWRSARQAGALEDCGLAFPDVCRERLAITSVSRVGPAVLADSCAEANSALGAELEQHELADGGELQPRYRLLARRLEAFPLH